MVLVTLLLAVFLYLFSPITNAKSYGAKVCANDSVYHCYVVKKGDTWSKLFSNSDERDLVMRINRINTQLHAGMTIAIPNKLKEDANLLSYAPVSTQIASPGRKIIIVSMEKLVFGAYNANGSLTYWGPVSGGKGYCPDVHRKCNSPRGDFTIYAKQGSRCVSNKFPVGRGGAPMPYCMFFYKGFALHGSYEVPGYHASHGCIRLFVNDARWLNQEFTSGSNVKVIINN